jgi:hypothetical protein
VSNLNKTNHPFSVSTLFVNNIFEENISFGEKAVSLFHYQYHNNIVYRNWCDAMHINVSAVATITDIPFLPISFFKTHQIFCGELKYETVFESSGTTQTINSKHFVKDISIYKKSFIKAFELFYGDIKNWCIIALLPSYLERNNSSLVMMADELIKLSAHAESGFYLYDVEKLFDTIKMLEIKNQKTLLLGVTYALLDFAEKYPLKLNNTIVMETGGMKGRREEMTRHEIHEILKNNFGVEKIHSEYGMTELLSQAYSKGDGLFFCAPTMKVLVRDEEDPLRVKNSGKGVLNIIDLANIFSCSFIATDDAGIVNEDGSFEVLGRLDAADIRGCSLLAI